MRRDERETVLPLPKCDTCGRRHGIGTQHPLPVSPKIADDLAGRIECEAEVAHPSQRERLNRIAAEVRGLGT